MNYKKNIENKLVLAQNSNLLSLNNRIVTLENQALTFSVNLGSNPGILGSIDDPHNFIAITY